MSGIEKVLSGQSSRRAGTAWGGIGQASSIGDLEHEVAKPYSFGSLFSNPSHNSCCFMGLYRNLPAVNARGRRPLQVDVTFTDNPVPAAKVAFPVFTHHPNEEPILDDRRYLQLF